MDYDYTINVEGKIFRVTVRGEDTLQARIDRLNEVVFHPEWSPGSNILEDSRGLSLMDMDINDIFQVTTVHVSRNEEIGDGKLAIVTRLGVVGSILQMWKSNTQELVSQQIRVFHDMESAEQWLNGEPRFCALSGKNPDSV